MTVKTPVGSGIAGGDVIAIVRKVSAGRETGSFADNFVALDNQLSPVGVFDHPFAAEQSHRAVGVVPNR